MPMRYFLSLLMLLTLPALGSEHLIDAARQGDTSALAERYAQGGDLDTANESGHTPFIMAAYHSHTDTLEWLLAQGAEPCATDDQGNNVYMGVAFRGHERTARWLLDNTRCDIDHRNHVGQTALMMAALFGREAIVELYLEHGAEAGVVDLQGNTAATLAAGQGQAQLAERLRAESS
ncbi:ankyrin repeat domain-containing protein [Billgrantia endophytica]|uniref:Uncharacterized protein n=1 Tax=Billgrantia endophytica TaxID=2033802 RepID=A0A2N7TYU7_9GAMM|nr:ankyrin repeat domain-containing protein [Halomonas endophytica]PMR73335.1 hypothetical protein C1H69_18575 [Halomonas endophytica]